MTTSELAWNLFSELRKEILSTQQLRARAIEFKITSVGVAVGIIVGKKDIDPRLLVLPAYAALFFDLLIISYSLAIKRKGAFARMYLEPILRKRSGWPKRFPLWEQFMSGTSQRQHLSFVANVGLSVLSATPAVAILLHDPLYWPNALMVVSIAGLLAYVAYSYRKLSYFVNPVRGRKRRAQSVHQ